MNSSEYQTYLNYLFDVFYCTLIAVYFFSRWSSKEVAVESSRDASTASTTSSASSKAIVASAGDPEAPDRPTTIAHITEQQPLKQQHQQNPPSEQNNLKPQQQQQSQQKQQHQQPQQQHQQKGPNKSKKGNNAKNNKNTRIHNNNNNSSNNVANNNNQLSTTSSSSSSASSNPGANSSNNYGRRGGAKNSITLEDGFDADENATSGSVAAICGVTGSVAGGDLQFSVANLTFFDVICISFVFPLCLLAIYLGWNLQTSVEVSWLSWRFLWGLWTERWTWWRLLLCLLAVGGITFLIKPKKVVGKSD